MRTLLLAAALLSAVSTSAAAQAPAAKATAPAAASAALADALAHPRREADRARDAWRHPAETLAFFRVQPGMTVVDYMPSGGWYTRVLVPYLGAQGRYIGLNPNVTNGSDGQRRAFGDLGATFPAKAAEWTGVPAERIAAFNTDTLPADMNGTVDRVLVFREVHNMLRNGWLYPDLSAMRALLKDDGLLGIVQHRARADAPAAYTNGSKGYLREKDVIALVEALGFELVGKSEINANPKDPADHAGGVWTLPPSFALKEVDRAKYAAIGESDRMTLLFRKRP